MLTDGEKQRLKETAELLGEFRQALYDTGFGLEGGLALMNSMARGGAFNGII
jgi:hypothetical protein